MAWGDAAACCIREAKPHGRPFWSIQSEHRHHWPRARPTQAAIVCCSCRRCLSSANARLRLQLRRAFCGSELMAPQLCRMRLRCAAASPQMPLLPLGYRAASTLGMACCSVQSQPAIASQGRDGRPALGTSARSLQSQAARGARRKKAADITMRPIYATSKGCPACAALPSSTHFTTTPAATTAASGSMRRLPSMCSSTPRAACGSAAGRPRGRKEAAPEQLCTCSIPIICCRCREQQIC